MLRSKGILTHAQQQFLKFFSRLPDQDRFYLTEGTALAEFYLGHRLSYDLDFFTGEDGLILPFANLLEATAIREGCQLAVIRRFSTFIEFQYITESEKVRVDLALDSPYRFEPVMPSEYGVMANDLTDLKADKLLAYYGRAEPRDAVDIFFILQQESLENLLTLTSQKDPGFDPYWLAIALQRAEGFPDEIERWPVKMLLDFDPVHLKTAFQSIALQLMADIFQRPIQ